MEFTMVSAGGAVLFILVVTLAAMLFKKHSKLSNNSFWYLGTVFSTVLDPEEFIFLL